MVNHTVSDMITRVRNAIRVKKSTVRIRATSVTKSISEILKREGYISDYRIMSDDPTPPTSDSMQNLELILKYHGKKMTPVFTNLKSISRPGVRFYAGTKEIPQVLDGLGISILSTSKGILTDTEARKIGIGGEILCMIW